MNMVWFSAQYTVWFMDVHAQLHKGSAHPLFTVAQVEKDFGHSDA